MSENKVRFGLKNVHYATFEEVDGVVTFDKPKKFPGAVELTIEPKGELSEFYADNEKYYVASSNQGYEGTYTCAEIPEDFRTSVLGDKLIGGVLVETTDAKTKPVALLYEFNGDVKATRHVLYNATFSRPSESGATTEDSTEVSTNELAFQSGTGPNGLVKAKTSSTTTAEIYDKWYDTVHIPTETPTP